MFQQVKRILTPVRYTGLLIGISALLASSILSAGEYPDPTRFEGAIGAFEKADNMNPPPQGAVLCIGSSSMRMWHSMIQEDLAPLTILPRGFGGSNMNDVLYFAERAVFPYAPRAIVVYEGDNDTAAGVPNEEILGKFKEFISLVHERLPECRLYFITPKPSISRVNILPIVKELNVQLKQICEADALLTFLDVESPMLNEEGLPLDDVFIGDNLHMNRKGYLIWREVIRPVLMENELPFEDNVLLHEDFEGDVSNGFAAALLNHDRIEFAKCEGRGNSNGIRVDYVGCEQGSEVVVVRYPLAKSVEKATLQFDVLFENDWQWVHGGKLHGLGPDKPITGGGKRLPTGWSARTMFKEDGKIATYLYDQDVEKKWGIGTTSESPVFTLDTWHRVEIEVRLNHPEEPDGYVRVRVDGEEVLLSVGTVFRGEGGVHTLISQMLFSTFHGGNTLWWTPVDADGNPTTVHARFDNFVVRSE